MEWVSVAEEFCGAYGWGARGKYIGISRMLGDNDKQHISRGKVFGSTRPRGILSGFLVIAPSLGYAVYLPPIAAKVGPQRIRMRISESIQNSGAIFSAFMTRDKRIVIEDVLVWNKTPVWLTTSFEKRWNVFMAQFAKQEFKNDVSLQGFAIEFAKYVPIADLTEPDSHTVLEFIPDSPNHKRMIWIPQKGVEHSTPLVTANEQKVAEVVETKESDVPAVEKPKASPKIVSNGPKYVRKELALGPDVYSVWDKESKTRIGLALVRTLAISRFLRQETAEEIDVKAEWNRQFEKWEIVGKA
jgi:hypothetical protein